MDDRDHLRAFVTFKLRAHLWNHHRVSGLERCTLGALGEVHRWYNCPPGDMRRYLGCHMRLIPRRVRWERHEIPDGGTPTQ